MQIVKSNVSSVVLGVWVIEVILYVHDQYMHVQKDKFQRDISPILILTLRAKNHAWSWTKNRLQT